MYAVFVRFPSLIHSSSVNLSIYEVDEEHKADLYIAITGQKSITDQLPTARANVII